MSKKKKLDVLITTNEENASKLIIANQENALALIKANKLIATQNKQEKLAKEKAIIAGCNDYISKPINKTLLYELIINYFKN
jgi:CheY-like chemotaxis protein